MKILKQVRPASLATLSCLIAVAAWATTFAVTQSSALDASHMRSEQDEIEDSGYPVQDVATGFAELPNGDGIRVTVIRIPANGGTTSHLSVERTTSWNRGFRAVWTYGPAEIPSDAFVFDKATLAGSLDTDTQVEGTTTSLSVEWQSPSKPLASRDSTTARTHGDGRMIGTLGRESFAGESGQSSRSRL